MIKVFAPRSGPISDYFFGIIRGGVEFVRVVKQEDADIVLVMDMDDLKIVWNEIQLFHVVYPPNQTLPEDRSPNVCFTPTMMFIGRGTTKLREQFTKARPTPVSAEGSQISEHN